MLSPTVLLRRATVLVADDEEQVRSYLARVLEDAGYRTVLASDGLQALALFEHAPNSFQLVITDLAMPRMGGRELAARLATHATEPPILFISGDYADDLPGPLLPKPFLPENLCRQVRTILRPEPRRLALSTGD